MKKAFAFIAALMLVLAACGDSGGGGGDVSSIDDCDGLADEVLDVVQIALDELSDLTLEDALAATDEPPEAITELETRTDELEARATELGCSDEEMGRKVSARVDELEANGPVAELILEGLKDDPDLFGN